MGFPTARDLGQTSALPTYPSDPAIVRAEVVPILAAAPRQVANHVRIIAPDPTAVHPLRIGQVRRVQVVAGQAGTLARDNRDAPLLVTSAIS